MKNIISLVEDVFSVKKNHGPKSETYKKTQNRVLEEIDKTFENKTKGIIRVDNSTVLIGANIRVEKKSGVGKPSDRCSFSLVGAGNEGPDEVFLN